MSRQFGPCGESIEVTYPVQKLAVDLTAPTTWNGESSIVSVTGIDASSGLTTVFSVPSAKGVVSRVSFGAMTSQDYTVKLTIDNEVKYNGVWTVTDAGPVLFGGNGGNNSMYDPVFFEENFLLEIQSTSDTSINADITYRKLD